MELIFTRIFVRYDYNQYLLPYSTQASKGLDSHPHKNLMKYPTTLP